VGNGETISVSASDLKDRIPLFVKDGAVIPMLTKPVDRARDAVGHPLELRWYGKSPGQGHLYEDDTETFGYEDNRYRRRIFRIRKGSDDVPSLEIETTGQPDQSLFGEVEKYTSMTQ